MRFDDRHHGLARLPHVVREAGHRIFRDMVAIRALGGARSGIRHSSPAAHGVVLIPTAGCTLGVRVFSHHQQQQQQWGYISYYIIYIYIYQEEEQLSEVSC